MYVLVMVLDDTAHLNAVLEAWQRAGVGGVTILESTGLNRVLMRHRPQAAYAGFSQIFGSGQVGHNTLFAVINDVATAEAAVAATEQVTGPLAGPDTGIMFLVPLVKAWGVLTTDDAATGGE